MKLQRGERALDELGAVTVGGVHLRTPFMTASGTAGHDVEFSPYLPLHKLGAIVVKSLFHEPWAGNPSPRVHTATSGMMNAVGLQGPGIPEWIRESLPKCEKSGANTIVSIWGRTVDEYVRAADQLSAVSTRIAAIEVNLSCPNLEGRSGIIAHDEQMSARIISDVSRIVDVPVWAKLSANTDRVVSIAQAVTEAGARSLTLINTMLGLQINTSTGQPTLGNGGGGFSGSAIHPIAVRTVFDVRSALPSVSIVGVGGISSGNDAIEMMMAGANAVQVGTASFANPRATWNIACDAARRAEALGATSWDHIVSRVHHS